MESHLIIQRQDLAATDITALASIPDNCSSPLSMHRQTAGIHSLPNLQASLRILDCGYVTDLTLNSDVGSERKERGSFVFFVLY